MKKALVTLGFVLTAYGSYPAHQDMGNEWVDLVYTWARTQRCDVKAVVAVPENDFTVRYEAHCK